MSNFGPQNANATKALPDGMQRQRYGADQTWVKDASAPGMSDGTVLDAAFFNRIIANLEFVASQGGAAGLPPGAVNVLYEAILGIIGEGAPGNLNTLAKIAQSINNDPSVFATFNAALGNRLRFDDIQKLSAAQLAILQTNLSLSNAAFSGKYADLAGLPTLGTAAALDVGTAANKIVQIGGDGKLPVLDGSKLTGIVVSSGTVAHGQCRLVLTGGNLVLSPYNGNLLTVNGVNAAIPDAGVPLAATGLTVGTTYFIYALATGSAITALEASTTTHATDTTAGNKGVEIKTADSTRTLVGMARVITGPAWADGPKQRLVRSYFNRKPGSLASAFTAQRICTQDVNLAELNIEVRQEFLLWADESIESAASGSMYCNNATATGGYVTLALSLDGIVTPIYGRSEAFGTSQQVYPYAVAAYIGDIAEGYHYLTLVGASTTAPGVFGGARLFGGFTSRISR